MRITQFPFGRVFMACLCIPAHGQEADYELVTIAIHSIRSETALPVTVLSGDELRNAARATIGETLGNQPGINNASFGPAVGQTVIRGQQGQRVMNLSNSMPSADASGNSADHAVAVEPVLADAIEVLRGPSTLLYGGGAIGGVVNVIDNRIPRSLFDRPVFRAEARHDSAADQDTATGRLEFSSGNLSWHLDGVRREWNDLDIPGFAIHPAYLEEDAHNEEHEEAKENTYGYIVNTGGETDSATLGLSYIFDNGFFGVALNQLENTYGLPSGAHDHAHAHDEVHEDDEHESAHAEENVFIDMENTRIDVTGEWRNLKHWIEHVDFRMSHTDYAHAEMEGPGVIGTRFSNDSWQQRLQLTHREMAGWHGVAGVQLSSEEFSAIGEESFIPVTEIESHGAFLVEDLHGENFTLELGLRLNRDNYSPQSSAVPDRDFSTLSYSSALLWDFSPAVSVGLTWSNSQRPPSIEEMYSNFGLADTAGCVIHFATASCEIGDAGFSEETSNNVDLTFYLEQERFSATITAFHNDFSDYLALATSGEESGGFPIRRYSQMDARFSGLEVDVTFNLSDFVSLQVFGDTIDGHLENNGAAPRMPPSRVGARLDWSNDAWSFYLSGLNAARQDNPGHFELPTAAYTRWDMGVDYRLRFSQGSDLLLFLRGRNTGDNEIRLATSALRGYAPEAGRSVEAGIRFEY